MAPSARTRPGPRAPWAPLARLWKPSSEGERPTLRYLEKLEFFCSLKERKTVLFPSELPEVLCCATRGQTANEISGPSLPEPGIRGSVEGSAPRIQPARTLGMLPPSAPQTAAGEETAFWRVLVLSQSLLTAVCRPQRQELGGTFFHMGSGSLRVADVLAGRRVLGTSL